MRKKYTKSQILKLTKKILIAHTIQAPYLRGTSNHFSTTFVKPELFHYCVYAHYIYFFYLTEKVLIRLFSADEKKINTGNFPNLGSERVIALSRSSFSPKIYSVAFVVLALNIFQENPLVDFPTIIMWR